jgi:hypothetical protein
MCFLCSLSDSAFAEAFGDLHSRTFFSDYHVVEDLQGAGENLVGIKV